MTFIAVLLKQSKYEGAKNACDFFFVALFDIVNSPLVPSKLWISNKNKINLKKGHLHFLDSITYTRTNRGGGKKKYLARGDKKSLLRPWGGHKSAAATDR